MFEEIKSIKTDKKSLRSFGITFGIILIIIIIILFINNNLFLKSLGIICFIFLMMGLIAPMMLKPIYLVWMVFAVILGWIMTRVILSLVFYLIVTPIGLITKLLGEDFLSFKKADSGSYWINRDSIKELNQDYKKQF